MSENYSFPRKDGRKVFATMGLQEKERVTAFASGCISRAETTVRSVKYLDEFRKTYLILICVVREVCILEEHVSEPVGLSDMRVQRKGDKELTAIGLRIR